MNRISKVGIIANPNSGKDIRRLVGYGSVCDNVEKTDIIKRIIIGLDAAGVDDILFMRDNYNFSGLAINGLSIKDKNRLSLKIKNIDMDVFGTEKDSITAGTIMNKLGVDCIIVLGGDGTSRAVALGCKDTPLMPISTGTNNVFPYKMEGTLAGFIAGLYSVKEFKGDELLNNCKHIELFINGMFKSIALVDLVVYDEPFIGTKALWETEKIMYVAVTRADIGNLGISSIVSNFNTISPADNYGLQCFLGGSDAYFTVKAAIAPGLICEVPIRCYSDLKVNGKNRIYIQSKNKWLTIALDGEREYEINNHKDVIEIELKKDSIFTLNPYRIMKKAVDNGLLVKRTRENLPIKGKI